MTRPSSPILPLSAASLARRGPQKPARRLLALGALTLLWDTGCGPAAGDHEATVELTRIRVVRRDAEGVPVTMDVELSYSECPGTQVEVIRGGKEFAACMATHKTGDRLKLKIRHFWSTGGQMDFEISQIGECPRPPDPNDEASFRMIRECEDLKVHGATVGFLCRIDPEEALVAKCPWFAKG